MKVRRTHEIVLGRAREASVGVADEPSALRGVGHRPGSATADPSQEDFQRNP